MTYPLADIWKLAPMDISANRMKHFPFVAMATILLVVATLWIVSSWCYYTFVNALKLDSGYDDAPILFASFYLIWSAIALGLFRPILSVYMTARKLLNHILALAPILMVYGFYVSAILPLLPDISAERAPVNPPEFMFASAWYYLPKSADILFQQILVAAMVLGAHRARINLTTISIGMAVLFGGFHLLLIFDGFSPIYVARFTFAGVLLGLMVPYLYLRTRYGFRWAYGLHWSFYAVDAAVSLISGLVPSEALGNEVVRGGMVEVIGRHEDLFRVLNLIGVLGG